jgi:Undecaprenyl-phosphate galactose phosphotransferase WbaP
MTGNHCFILLLALADWAAVVLAEGVAVFLRNFFVTGTVLRLSAFNFWIVFPAIFLLFFAGAQLYTRRRPFYKETERIFYACLFAVAAIVFLLYVTQIAASTSRLFVMLLALLAFPVCALVRYGAKKFLQKSSSLQTPILIIGAGKTAVLLIHSLTEDVGMACRIVGVLEDGAPEESIADHYPLLGRFDDAERVIRETKVAHVIIAAPGLPEKDLAQLIYRVQPLVKNLCVIPNLVGVAMGSAEIESLFEEKLVLLRLTNNLARPANRFVKTLFDYTLTIFGTIMISPVLLIIALWIYKDSPGPVIFKHTRIGKGGKPFACYKFRSMCVDSKERLEKLLATDPAAREEWERDFKLKNDPRITKSGAFLRKTSLDELPQIFNVLKGEMSLVGPRPIIDKELPRYGKFADDYLMVKPGITGMWQVSGRSDIDYPERVRMDSWYVRNWSVWIDIVLLFKTFYVVLARKGAY